MVPNCTTLRSPVLRGVGVHHAGVLPRYRRIVEELFQEKLLTVCVCTETLAAGINLPAKRVVFPSLRKFIRGKARILLRLGAEHLHPALATQQVDHGGRVGTGRRRP